MQPLTNNPIQPAKTAASSFTSSSFDADIGSELFPKTFEETLKQTQQSAKNGNASYLPELEDTAEQKTNRIDEGETLINSTAAGAKTTLPSASTAKDDDRLDDLSDVQALSGLNSTDHHLATFTILPDLSSNDTSKTAFEKNPTGYNPDLSSNAFSNTKAGSVGQVPSEKNKAEQLTINKIQTSSETPNLDQNLKKSGLILEETIVVSSENLAEQNSFNREQRNKNSITGVSRGQRIQIENEIFDTQAASLDIEKISPKRENRAQIDPPFFFNSQTGKGSPSEGAIFTNPIENTPKLEMEVTGTKDTSQFRLDSSQEIKPLTLHPHTTPSARTEFPASIPRQIADSIQARIVAEKTIEISLNPAELGRLKLSLSPAENGLVINVLAERVETLEIIKRNIQDLESVFAEQGHENLEFSFQQNDQSFGRDNKPDLEGSLASLDHTNENEISPVANVSANPLATVTSGIDMRV
ncbi:MAG: flagellar hook-length control protein FliK [Roseobacter sp.]